VLNRHFLQPFLSHRFTPINADYFSPMKNFFPVLIVLLMLFTGCSDKVKITGQVKFDDGEPVNFGKVVFNGKGKSFFGNISKDGHYSPGEIKDGDGVPYGTYKVWLAGTVLSEEGKEVGKGEDAVRSSDFKETYRVDEKYTSAGKTDITFEVKKGGAKNLDFTVTRPPAKKGKK
jgi:hypothetical protein